MKIIINLLVWRRLLFLITLQGMILFAIDLPAQVTISGTVTDKQSGTPLPGSHISAGNNPVPVVSDINGHFKLTNVKKGVVNIKVTFIGYKTFTGDLVAVNDTTLSIALEGTALLGEEVNITAYRAQEKYPSAHSSISKQEIKNANLGKDIPAILQELPSAVSSSDAGNGIGYSNFSIRGTDLTRINVTINSIPLNDAESQGVWFVDLPDLASSTTSIQVQRGVGTSTNGAGAFGASINMATSDLHQDPYGELDISGGSFRTFKSTLRFGTGLMAGKVSVDGRLSYIHSDGYIDRAFSNLKSFYLAAGYYAKNTTLRLITFSGTEQTYQAWEGVPKDSLSTNRTYNPAGQYLDGNGNIAYYDNQTDNYQQDHYQILFSQTLAKHWNMNAALFYAHGKGYFENYQQDAAFADYGLNDVIVGNDTITTTDLVNRKMMDNDFYGITFSSNYSIPDRLKVTLGGGYNRYYGEHFGKINWAEYASNGNNSRNWYYNTGDKGDFCIFGKGTWQMFPKLSIYADLQYRFVSYDMHGTKDDLQEIEQTNVFNFFNPKGGLYFEANKNNDLYFSFGMANREPSRSNYLDADLGHNPVYETLCDYELGYSLKIPRFRLNANLYYMVYDNQLILTGEINDVGAAIMVNVPSSYRTGIELTGTVDILDNKLQWKFNATLSRNRIKNFTQYIDTYNADWQFTGQDTVFLGETNLSFSPRLVAGSTLTYKPIPQLALSLNTKYVGKQFIDNTSNDDRSLDGYLVNGFGALYTLRIKKSGEIGFNLAVNNLFNQKYESNAWIYPYYLDGSYSEFNGYFPQALLNFLFGISIKI